MRKRNGLTRRAALGLVGAGAVASVIHSYSRTSSVADRMVGLSVVGDASAFIGLDFAPSVRSNRNSERLVTVSNNLPSGGLSVDIELLGDAQSEMTFSDTGTTTTSITLLGGSEDVTVDVDQGAHNQVDTVDVSIEATSGSLSISLTRSETSVVNPGGGGGSGNDVDTNGNAIIGNGETVGNVWADNGATVRDGGTVEGDLCAGSTVTISGRVDGDVTVDGDVNLHSSGSVGGTVEATGNINLGGTIEGDAITAGVVNDNGGTVQGTVTENYTGSIDLCH